MKKLILLSFALLFSVSSTFAYRTWSYLEVGEEWYYHCYLDGGTCLPTVVIE